MGVWVIEKKTECDKNRSMEQKDILIVDDDENMNFALFETLRRKNYSVERALSYLEAKEKIRTCRSYWKGRQKQPGAMPLS